MPEKLVKVPPGHGSDVEDIVSADGRGGGDGHDRVAATGKEGGQRREEQNTKPGNHAEMLRPCRLREQENCWGWQVAARVYIYSKNAAIATTARSAGKGGT